MKKHLSLRITALLAFYTLIISIISSLGFYQYSYNKEMKQSINSAEQLLETVIETAAIAAFLDQYEMAEEVVAGLAKNDIVAKVTLRISNGQIVEGGNKVLTTETQSVVRPLKSPFSDAPIGELILTPDIYLIEQRAKATGIANAIVLVGQTMLITLLAMFLSYTLLTRPIQQIARRLHRIVPGGNERLEYPKSHQNNEIGSLVTDTNKLLDSVQEVIANERDLREKVESLEIQYHRIFSRSYAAIFIANQKGSLITHNQSFEKVIERTDISVSEGASQVQVYEIFEDQVKVVELIEKASKEGRSIEADLELRVTSGKEPVWTHCTFSITYEEHYKEPLVEGVLFDITERKTLEQLSQHQAEHDQLTGLLNRHGAERKLHQIFNGDRFSDNQLTILLLDLDGFKSINDTHGHDAGDAVLAKVSDRLSLSTRESDQVIRWGGDEFLIIVNGDISIEDIRILGRKLVKSIASPIELGNGVMGNIGVSIGITTLTNEIKDLHELIKRADQAMYEVKYQGKNNFCIYDSSNSILDMEMTI